MSAGWVMEIVDGRARSSDMYEPDDIEGMLARFAELTEAEGAGPLGDRPPKRFSDAYARAFRTQDLDQIAALYDEDYVLADHSPRGWEPIRRRDGDRGFAPLAPRAAERPDRVRHVLACDDRVIVSVESGS